MLYIYNDDGFIDWNTGCIFNIFDGEKMSDKFLLLEDVPCSDDQLKSHQGIAAAMERIICEGNGGKTIGLEGKWGAGKSSVIKLLEKGCADQNKQVFFFNFDAWVHAGDPLRRAFLEGLIEACAGEKGFFRLPEGSAPQAAKHASAQKESAVCVKWLKTKFELSQRIKQHEKHVEPIISGFGKALFTSLAFLPVALSMLTIALTKFEKSLVFDAWPLCFAEGMLVVAGIGVAMPFLVMVAHLLRRPASGERGQMWTIFFLKGPSSERSQVSESLEPSTIEFQALFQQLMADLLKGNQWKLVIVLDNLDRLSDQEAATVWPVLRAFIDNAQFAGSEWFKRLWVIVPYARDALLVPSVGMNEFSDPAPGKSDIRLREAGIVESNSHFLDKIFQLIIYVPAPVLSNWRTYMDRRLSEVFPAKATPDALHTMYVLFTRCYGVSHPPGPRELISIINNMVIIELQWGEKISLAHYAYFSILKRSKKIHDLRREILEGRIALHKDLLGNDIENSLLALESSLPTATAAQILYRQLIDDVLSSRSAGRSLAERYGETQFADLFDTVIGDILCTRAKEDGMGLVDALLVLLDKSFIEKYTAQKRAMLISDVGKAIAAMRMLPMDCPRLVDAIEALVHEDEGRVLKECLAAALYRSRHFFTDTRHQALFKMTAPGDAESLQSLHRLWTSRAARTYFGDLDALKPFDFPLSAAHFIAFFNHLKQHGREELIHPFDLSSMAKELREELSVSFDKTDVSSIVSSLRFLDARSETIELPLLKKLIARIAETSATQPENVVVVLPYLFEVTRAHDEAKTLLLSLTGSGSLYEYLRIFKPDPQNDVQFMLSEMRPVPDSEKEILCGYLLYLLLYYYPELPSATGSGKVGQTYLQTMLEKTEKYSGILMAFRNVVNDMGDLARFLKRFRGSNAKRVATFLDDGVLPSESLFDADHIRPGHQDNEIRDELSG